MRVLVWMTWQSLWILVVMHENELVLLVINKTTKYEIDRLYHV